MESRRAFLKLGLILNASTLMPTLYAKENEIQKAFAWYMPEESELHKRTWMLFIASYDIWDDKQVPEVLRNMNEAFPAFIVDYKKECKGRGMFSDSEEEMLAVWVVGLANLACSRGMNFTYDNELIPKTLVVV